MDLCLRLLDERKATKVGSTATVSGTVYWSYPILPFGTVAYTFFPDQLSRNSRLKILFTLMQINPLFKLGRILDVSVFSSWKLTYPPQTSFPGFSPTRPYGARETGRRENLGTRMLSPSCLFNGYKGSCDKNFLSKTTSSPYFLRYVISSREAIITCTRLFCSSTRSLLYQGRKCFAKRHQPSKF